MITSSIQRRWANLSCLIAMIGCVNAGTFTDTFEEGIGLWSGSEAWNVRFLSRPGYVLLVNTQGDEFAWQTGARLAGSWRIQARFSVAQMYNDNGTTGTAGIALGNSTYGLTILADAIKSDEGWILPGLGYWDGSWYGLIGQGTWFPGGGSGWECHSDFGTSSGGESSPVRRGNHDGVQRNICQ